MKENSKSPVTLQDIAKKTGFHVSTVSLALRHHSKLAADTRAVIQQAAAEMGYRPNPMVSALMHQIRSNKPAFRGNLAYLRTMSPKDPRASYPVFSNFQRGARERAEQLGYTLEQFFLYENKMSQDRLLHIFNSRSIVGVIIEYMQPALLPPRTLDLDLSAYATAQVGLQLASPKIHYAVNDQFQRPMLAVQRLSELGYRRIGFVTESNVDNHTNHRVSAGFWAIQQAMEPCHRVPICYANPRSQKSLITWIEKYQPDVVISQIYEVPETLKKHGYSFPDDIGWVSLDWFEYMAPWAGVYGNSDGIGHAATDLVVNQVNKNETGIPQHPKCVLTECTWMPGDSVKRVGKPYPIGEGFFSMHS